MLSALDTGRTLLGLYQPRAHPSQRETSHVVLHLAGSGASRLPALVPGLPLPGSGRGQFGIVRVPAGMPLGAEESRQAWDSPPTHPPGCRGAPHLPRPGRFAGLSPGATVTPTGHLEPCTPSRPASGKSAPVRRLPSRQQAIPRWSPVRQKGPALKRCSNSKKREREFRDRPPRVSGWTRLPDLWRHCAVQIPVGSGDARMEGSTLGFSVPKREGQSTLPGFQAPASAVGE